MITIQIPRGVGEEEVPLLVKKGHRVIGEFTNPPRVVDGTLVAGKCILVARNLSIEWFESRVESARFYVENGHKHLEVRYGDEYVVYRLEEEKVYWSDGPPHPNHLQLGVRVRTSAGVKEYERPKRDPSMVDEAGNQAVCEEV